MDGEADDWMAPECDFVFVMTAKCSKTAFAELMEKT